MEQFCGFIVEEIQRNMRWLNLIMCHMGTKDILITKGQVLVDQEHDNRLKYCCVQLDAESFIVWNFEKEYLVEKNQGCPWTELPKFH